MLAVVSKIFLVILVKLFFGLSRDVAVATNFVGKIGLLPSPCSSRNIR